MKSIILLILLTLPAVAWAQGSSTGESYLKFLFPARVLSMGEAPIADPSNATSSFANPACLASSNSAEIMFSQLQWIQDVQTQLLSASVPLPLGTASLAISSTSVGDIEVRDVPGPSLGTFNAHFNTFQVGYGATLFQDFSFGATAKYLYDKLYVDDASGFGVDFGALYKSPMDGLTFGLSLTNYGNMNKLRTQASDLPSRSNLGLNYQIFESEFKFIGNLAVSKETNSGTTAIHVGAEVNYNDLLSLRLGYQTSYDIRGLSAGLGIHYSILQLDYAFVPFSQGFGEAHIITMAVQL